MTPTVSPRTRAGARRVAQLPDFRARAAGVPVTATARELAEADAWQRAAELEERPVFREACLDLAQRLRRGWTASTPDELAPAVDAKADRSRTRAAPPCRLFDTVRTEVERAAPASVGRARLKAMTPNTKKRLSAYHPHDQNRS